MFGDSELGFFQTWENGIVLVFLLFIGFWILSVFTNSKTGKKANNTFQKTVYPVSKWYGNLSHNLRTVIGWISLTAYCLAIVATFIWIQS